MYTVKHLPTVVTDRVPSNSIAEFTIGSHDGLPFCQRKAFHLPFLAKKLGKGRRHADQCTQSMMEWVYLARPLTQSVKDYPALHSYHQHCLWYEERIMRMESATTNRIL